MVLFPMHDARHRGFDQLLKRDMHADGAEADAFGGGADAEHAHPFPPDEALLPERLQRVVLAIVLGHHPQAGGAAVHGIKLVVIWEFFTHNYIAYIRFEHSLYIAKNTPSIMVKHSNNKVIITSK